MWAARSSPLGHAPAQLTFTPRSGEQRPAMIPCWWRRTRVPLRLFVGITDRDWYELLRQLTGLDEVNFWAPGGTAFKALGPGELFLFKLHAPDHYIVGGGVFAYSNSLPCSLAWETFGQANGARSGAEMRARITRLRRADPRSREDFVIGCRILTQPFFLERSDWIPVPSWARQIVQGKTYSTEAPTVAPCGSRLQAACSRARSSPRSSVTAPCAGPTPPRPGCVPGPGRRHLPSAVRRNEGACAAGARRCPIGPMPKGHTRGPERPATPARHPWPLRSRLRHRNP